MPVTLEILSQINLKNEIRYNVVMFGRIIFMILFMAMLPVLIIAFMYGQVNFFSYNNFRISLVYTIGITSLIIFVITELLSCIKLLSFIGLSVVYVALDLTLLLYLSSKGILGVFFSKIEMFIVERVKKSDNYERVNSILVVTFIVYETVMAVLTVPYNADSMAYHLPRIYYWTQSKTVEHYATNYLQQVATATMAEFTGTHIYILSGKQDYFLNLIQCFSLILCGFVIKWITELLIERKMLSYLAMWIWYFCPIALAESLTTQTDLLASLWILLFAYVLLWLIVNKSIEVKKNVVFHFFILGVFVGLAYNTKVHIIVAMIVYTGLLLVYCLKCKTSIRIMLVLASTTVITAIVVAIPEMIRICLTFGALFPELGGAIMLVKTVNPRYLAVNVIKGIVYNMTTNVIPDTRNWAIVAVNAAATIFGVELNDERISWHDFYVHPQPWYSHDSAPYPLVMYCFLIAFFYFIFLIIRKKRKNALAVQPKEEIKNYICIGYSSCSIISFFLIMTINRHVDANVRYQLVYIALIIPFIVYVLSLNKSYDMTNCIIGGISVLLIISFINQTIYNVNIIKVSEGDRAKGYLNALEGTYSSYVSVANVINDTGAKTVGTHIHLFSYPMLKMLESRGEYLIYDVNVDNITKKYEDERFKPEVLVYISFDDLPESMECHGDEYHLIYSIEDSYENYAVYMR